MKLFELLCVWSTRKKYDASVLLPGSSAVVAHLFVKRMCMRSFYAHDTETGEAF
jgi:hypothetical protein